MLYIDTDNGLDYLANPLVPEALPEFLQRDPKFAHEELLYFYSPAQPVVILGHYQDVYHEVNLQYLREHKIALVRRNSGGGAVFVDPGDLTYVYIDTAQKVKTPKFDQYIRPILKALRQLGVDAQQTGRNDLTYQGQKFSGMSFANVGDRVSYGGTLMVNVDLDQANQVLTPPKSKLEDKGIESVRSRVTNLLPHFNRPTTTRDLRELILQNVRANDPDFHTYQLTKEEWQAVLDLGKRKYGAKTWIYGSSLASHYVDLYFHGVGSVGIGFDLDASRLTHVKLYGDLMYLDQKRADQIARALDGTQPNKDRLVAILEQFNFDQSVTSGAATQVADKLVEEAAKGAPDNED
ncbi:lipoyl protein ligase domain-containing protein [Limosilactobacillus sp.]|uniref:lipoyl protein ligase domain-containing protein n=1 Tax=Limosilactobacillus sp. TaxID=2773925 RepID=UPI0025C4111F|nr:lipoate protein ligase C-terminal domain-containing protein [Limosilactobacillus sp.]MCH3921335.1 lipoate--protein ligase family protein [Limosilactobacillus sp.]MCH3928106.1 lipoate--protein ligase family protein [Limosilactobacillus sp.]